MNTISSIPVNEFERFLDQTYESPQDYLKEDETVFFLNKDKKIVINDNSMKRSYKKWKAND